MNKREQETSGAQSSPATSEKDNPILIGGQAVIEGVMMRAPNAIATAVRRANGDIVVKKIDYKSLGEKNKLCKLPFLRGAIGIIEMLFIGIKTLNFSADIAMLDIPSTDNKKKKSNSSSLSIGLTVVFALFLAVVLFLALPLTLATALFNIENNPAAFNLTAGLIRIIILLGYIFSISFMKDVQRLFQYHGAEHKTVFACENKEELTPFNAANYSRFHPRCGTSFLLVVAIVSILAFALLDSIVIMFTGTLTLPIRLITHFLLAPFVAGLAYEVIRFSARKTDTRWGGVLVAPGLWTQRITTKEPDESQLEVACVALKCALGTEDASKYSLKEYNPNNAASTNL